MVMITELIFFRIVMYENRLIQVEFLYFVFVLLLITSIIGILL